MTANEFCNLQQCRNIGCSDLNRDKDLCRKVSPPRKPSEVRRSTECNYQTRRWSVKDCRAKECEFLGTEEHINGGRCSLFGKNHSIMPGTMACCLQDQTMSPEEFLRHIPLPSIPGREVEEGQWHPRKTPGIKNCPDPCPYKIIEEKIGGDGPRKRQIGKCGFTGGLLGSTAGICHTTILDTEGIIQQQEIENIATAIKRCRAKLISTAQCNRTCCPDGIRRCKKDDTACPLIKIPFTDMKECPLWRIPAKLLPAPVTVSASHPEATDAKSVPDIKKEQAHPDIQPAQKETTSSRKSSQKEKAEPPSRDKKRKKNEPKDYVCEACRERMKDPLPDHACSWCKEEQEKRGRRAWVTNLNLDTLHLGDMVELGERIPDESVDVIFTDPPYLKDLYQNAYARLAVLAARVLKPHGFLFTYAPQTHLDDIMDILRYSRLGGQEQNLQYFWVIESLNSGAQTAKNHQRNAICLHKPILVFQKAPEGMPLKGARRCFADVVRGLRQKQFHPWQQSVHDVLGIISRFCVSGDIVLDPYAGTGTTLKAANLLGLNWIGFEIDQKTHAIAVREMQQKPIGLFSFGGEEPEPAPAREAETPTDNSRQVSIGDPPAKKGSTGKAARTPMETLADEAKEQFIRVPENIVNPEPFIQQCCGTCGHHKGRKTFHDSCPRLGELLFKGGTKSAKVLMEETSRTPCEQYIEKGE